MNDERTRARTGTRTRIGLLSVLLATAAPAFGAQQSAAACKSFRETIDRTEVALEGAIAEVGGASLARFLGALEEAHWRAVSFSWHLPKPDEVTPAYRYAERVRAEFGLRLRGLARRTVGKEPLVHALRSRFHAEHVFYEAVYNLACKET